MERPEVVIDMGAREKALRHANRRGLRRSIIATLALHVVAGGAFLFAARDKRSGAEIENAQNAALETPVVALIEAPHNKAGPAEIQAEKNAERAAPAPRMDVIAQSAAEESHVYEISGTRVRIPTAVAAAFIATEKRTGMPTSVMALTCKRESNCLPESINPHTQACGLFQFLPGTLLEGLYLYGPDYGYGLDAMMVERYTRKTDAQGRPYYGYRAAGTTDEERAQTMQEISQLCLQPEFNAAMFAAYHKPNIEAYKKWLNTGRDLTAGEIVVLNNLGLQGMKAFFAQVLADKKSGQNTLARNFFSTRIARQNPSLVRFADGRDKTVRDTYNGIINNHGGWDELEMDFIQPEQVAALEI